MGLPASDKLLFERVERTIDGFIPVQERATSELHTHALGLVRTMIATIPDSYERAMAVSRVEEAVMWAITAAHHAAEAG
jgi:hypothetical protein